MEVKHEPTSGISAEVNSNAKMPKDRLPKGGGVKGELGESIVIPSVARMLGCRAWEGVTTERDMITTVRRV